MPQTSHRRWTPDLGLYPVEHEGAPALVVLPDVDLNTASSLGDGRIGQLSNDTRILPRFLALEHPSASIETVAAFVLRYGIFGCFKTELCSAAAKVFTQPIVELSEYQASLIGGSGHPRLSLNGLHPVITLALYRQVARFIKSIIVLHKALRGHDATDWRSYSKHKEIIAARAVLEEAGFTGGNIAIMAGLEHAMPPEPSGNRNLDDSAVALAKHAGDDVESPLRTMVETSPGSFTRSGPLDAEGREILKRVHAWRAYWAALESVRKGSQPSAALREQYQRRYDVGLVEAAAGWLVSTSGIGVSLVASREYFSLQYAPTTMWQALVLALARELIHVSDQRLWLCRLCGSAFIPESSPRGGRPRKLCDECFNPRVAKTISERHRRLASRESGLTNKPSKK